jgi:hypothetical protein
VKQAINKFDKKGNELFIGDVLSYEESIDFWSTCCGVIEERRGELILAYNWRIEERYDLLDDVINGGFIKIGNIKEKHLKEASELPEEV